MFPHRTRLNCAQVVNIVGAKLQAVAMRRSKLPENLPLPAFTLAEAKALGVSRSRTVALDLLAPSRGLRRFTSSEPDALSSIRSHLAVTPGGFASHFTAARLWDIPLPAWAEAQGEIDISRRNLLAAPRRKGVIGHRLRIDREEVTLHQGLWLTTPARTWQDLAPLLTEQDLVVAGDFLVRSRQRDFSTPRAALCSIDDLLDRLRPRAGGTLRCRVAAAMVRPGVDSPQETRLRLALVSSGLPEPTVNHSLDDEFDGHPIRWADLAYVEHKIVIQYEGDQHRSRGQFAADIARDEDWQRAGWTVIRLTSADLHDGAAYAVAKVRAGLLRSGWLPN